MPFISFSLNCLCKMNVFRQIIGGLKLNAKIQLESLCDELTSMPGLSDQDYLKVLDQVSFFLNSNQSNPGDGSEFLRVKLMHALTSCIRNSNKYHLPHPPSLSKILFPSEIELRHQQYFSLEESNPS